MGNQYTSTHTHTHTHTKLIRQLERAIYAIKKIKWANKIEWHSWGLNKEFREDHSEKSTFEPRSEW